MQEILVLLPQLKSSLLNMRNILLSEPQLTPARTSAMMVIVDYQENWKTQPVRLWCPKNIRHWVGNKNGWGSHQQVSAHKYSDRSC